VIVVSALLLATVAAATPAPESIAADTVCWKSNLPDNVRQKSPLDSVTFKVGGKAVKLCYGRPSLRGRAMVVGAQDPYGQVWRTGANEPTIFFTPIALTIAGLKVPAGKYSLYTVPGEKEWEIIVNRSTSQWGNDYNPNVQAQELGRAKVPSEPLQQPIEQFTIRPDAAGDAKALVLEWQNFRVRIPIAAT